MIEEVVLTQNDADRELLAKIVAKALTEEDFRTIIKSEAMLMFDGDYDVLYSKVGTKQNAKGNSIESYLLNTYNQMKGKYSSQSEFEKLVNFIPYFQISVPVNCEEWDTKNYTPLVTYIPANLDESTAKTTRAFDSNGNLHILSLEKYPEMPVVVIGSCERVDEKGEIKGQIMQISDKPINENDKVVRQSGMKEYVYKIKFNNLSFVEPWTQGGPEVKYFVISSASTLTNYDILSFSRSQVNNTWYYCYANVITNWYFDQQDGFALEWIETDNGPETQTLKIASETFSKYVPVTISYEVKWAKSDKKIISKPVDSRHSKYQIYGSNSSVMQWGEAFWF